MVKLIETTRVFRIAFEDIKTGLWYNKPKTLDANAMNALKGLERRYPMPYDEKIPKNYLCCCPSFETLSEYFGDYLQHLLNVGFKIYVYEIPCEYVQTYKTHHIADFSKGVLVNIIKKCGVSQA